LFNLAAQHFPVLALGYIYGLYEAGLYALVMRVCGSPLGLLGQAVAQVYASDFRDHLSKGQGGLARIYVAMLLRLLPIGAAVVFVLVLVMNLWGTWLFGGKWANIGAVSLLVSVMLITDFATTPVSMTMGYLGRESVQLAWDIGRFMSILCVFAAGAYFSLRFGQLLMLFAGVWSLSLLIHAWLTYRACCLVGGGGDGVAVRKAK
jgi:O-antigen/teichoic acid export membrane protein